MAVKNYRKFKLSNVVKSLKKALPELIPESVYSRLHNKTSGLLLILPAGKSFGMPGIGSGLSHDRIGRAWARAWALGQGGGERGGGGVGWGGGRPYPCPSLSDPIMTQS